MMRPLFLASIVLIAFLCFTQVASADRVRSIGVTNKTGQCAEVVYHFRSGLMWAGPYDARNLRPGDYYDIHILNVNDLAQINVKMWPTADCSGSLNHQNYAYKTDRAYDRLNIIHKGSGYQIVRAP
jgi:hypothetical protein